MTPEREVYARMRVTRLDTKISQLEFNIRQAAIPPVSDHNARYIERLQKSRRSSVASRRRWLKELGEAS